jgi:hypothetical protein
MPDNTTAAPARRRSPARTEFLTDILVTAIEHNGAGFCHALEYRPTDDGTAYALIVDSEEPDGEQWRVDLDTIATGLGIIRNATLKEFPRGDGTEQAYANKTTGERLYLDADLRAQILAADRTNHEEGDIDVTGALAILECAIFGKVIYA